MSIRDLIPWKWGRKKEAEHHEETHALSTLQRDMNRLFEDFYRGFDRDFDLTPFGGRFGFLSNGSHGLSPKIDVSETDDEVEVTAELPGLSEDDIDVSIHDDVMRIRAQKKQEKEEKTKNYYLKERSYGSIFREIPLWSEVDADKVDARFKKGVLTIRVPKLKDATTSKRIAVRTA